MGLFSEAAMAIIRSRNGRKIDFILQRLSDLGFTNTGGQDYNDAFEQAGRDYDLLKAANQESSYYSNVIRSGRGGQGFLSQVMRAQFDFRTARLDEFGSLEKTAQGIESLFTVLRHPLETLNTIKGLVQDEVILYLTNINKLYSEINVKSAMTGELAEAFRTEIMSASPWAIKLGIGFNELAESVGNLVSKSGKFKLINDDTLKEMALASKFIGGMERLSEMGRNFELIGLGLRDMSTYVQDSQIRSQSLGLNARETLKIVDENLKNINAYGFRNGVMSLERMAQKSIEFRTNMSEVFKLAEQVWEPDKALELVANLQVIGGAVGALNDPLKLMYMATNDLEGLQDALIESTKAFATFNNEQGRFEITGVNLRRAREAAKILGMDYNELAKSAIASMERQQAIIDMAGKGLKIDEKDREFIINLARMEGGQMVIDIPADLRKQLQMLPTETSIALSDLSEQNIETLVKQRQLLEDMRPEDVVRRQVMALENVERDVSFIRGALRVSIGKNASDFIEKAIGINSEFIGDLSDAIADLGVAGIDKMDKYLQNAIKDWGGLVDIRNSFGKSFVNNIRDLTNDITNIKTKQSANIETEAKNLEIAARKNESTKSPETLPEQRIIVTHNVNLNPMDSTTDKIAQIFMADRRFAEEWANSFLNPNSN